MKLSALADIRQGMVMAGSGVGARPGDWELHVVESADIVDDHLDLSELRSVRVQRDVRSEAHLLNPYDILVTARSHAVKVALVPRDVRRTVAGPTLLVVRASAPWSGLAHFLWYYLSSTIGRGQVVARLTATTLPTLSVRELSELPVRVPPPDQLDRMADLIVAAEWSRAASLEAVRVRHDVVRDAIIARAVAEEEA